MKNMYKILFVLPLVTALPAAAQTTESPLIGVKLAPVPASRAAQAPYLLSGQGVLIEDVLPDSPAARAGLCRDDILLTFDGVLVRNGEQFLKLAAGSATQGRVPVVILRGGKKNFLKVSLLSPPEADGPKAILKPGGPPALAVYSKGLPDGKLSVTFTFYSKKSSKLEKVTCSGSFDDIKKKVKDLGDKEQMPPRVQDLADLAVDRLRVLKSPGRK